MSRYRPLHRCRAGFTLIEMAVVIGIVSALLAGGAWIIATMLQADAGQRADLLAQAEYDRLADTFRRDVHHAVDATQLSNEKVMFLQPTLTTVIYSLEPDGTLQREEHRADGSQAHEGFHLASNLQAKLELDADRSLAWVRLENNMSEGESLGARPRSLSIVARYGQPGVETTGEVVPAAAADAAPGREEIAP